MDTDASSQHRTLAVAFAGASAFLGLYATQPLLPTLERLFHVGKSTVSLTVTASTLGVALSAPLVGSVADRFGRKRVIVVSATLLALATLLNATARSLPGLVFWRFMQGLFTPGVFAITVAYVQEEWHEGAGRAMAAYVTGTVLGGFLGRITAGLLGARLGWQVVFLFLGSLGLLAAGALHVWLPVERHFSRRGGSLRIGTIRHLRNPHLTATFAAGFCVLFSLLATFTYITFYLAAPPFHLGPAALGFLFFVYLVGAVITPPCGRAIDRFGHRTVLAVSMAASIVGILLTLVPSLVVVIIGLALCCSGVFVAQACANGYIGLATDRGKALAVGLYVTFYYIGGSAGAELPGFLWRFGGWPACVALIVVVQSAIIAITRFGWSAHGEHSHDPLPLHS
ncbi:MAG TPA: MFS transporter [Holophaga sp.]|nr:MFS transporter [Holophaga sp.]